MKGQFFHPQVNGGRSTLPVPCTPIKEFIGIEGFVLHRTKRAENTQAFVNFGWRVYHRALGIAVRYDLTGKTQHEALGIAAKWVAKHADTSESPKECLERMIAQCSVRETVNAFQKSAQSAQPIQWAERAERSAL